MGSQCLLLSPDQGAVTTRQRLRRSGVTDSTVLAQLAAQRWQQVGRAIVLHNGPLSRRDREEVVLACCSRGVLTSFTALERAGLKGWERDTVHVLVGNNDRRPIAPGIPLQVHRSTRTTHAVTPSGRPRVPFAAVVASSSFRTARPAVGLLAAVVQQRLATAEALETAIRLAARTRHRRALLLAIADIGMGSQALSEIDFVTLCHRAGLPPPHRQAVRLDSTGRRRYLDALWHRPDGSTLAVEVDGSLHLTPQYWWGDQLRQNQLVLVGTTVLRYPSVVVREESGLVVRQLAQALGVDLPTTSTLERISRREIRRGS